MRIKYLRHLSGVVPAVILFAWSSQAVHAQNSVENFVELAPTDFGYVNQATRDRMNDQALQTSTRPFKIFDNLYYVGIEWAASYLLVTSEGLILIDSLFEPYIEIGVEHIRELGFDPADIEYVLGTHGHFDHMGGHAYYQRNFGAQVGLTAADWKRAQVDQDHPVFATEVADAMARERLMI